MCRRCETSQVGRRLRYQKDNEHQHQGAFAGAVPRSSTQTCLHVANTDQEVFAGDQVSCARLCTCRIHCLSASIKASAPFPRPQECSSKFYTSPCWHFDATYRLHVCMTWTLYSNLVEILTKSISMCAVNCCLACS